MFKKMLPWLLMILISITLIALAAFILWEYMDKKSNPVDPNSSAAKSVKNVQAKKLTAKEKLDLTVRIDDVITNLANKDIVKLSFAFLLENKKTKDEFTSLDFIVKNIIIQTLADMKPEELDGSQGIDNLNTKLINRITPELQEGKLVQVFITNKILQ